MKMIISFDHLVDCLFSLCLKFVAPSVSHIYVGNDHARQHAKLSIKTHVSKSSHLNLFHVNCVLVDNTNKVIESYAQNLVPWS
jgi:hypothetical protein